MEMKEEELKELREEFKRSFHGGITSDGTQIVLPPKLKYQIADWFIERIKRKSPRKYRKPRA